MLDEITSVDPMRVLISFLVSDDVVVFVNESKQFDNLIPQQYIKQRFSFYNKLSITNLETKVHDKNRLKRILDHRWLLQKIPLKYIGTWPGTGNLPEEWSAFSVLDISERLKRLKGKNITLYSVQKIYSMIPYINEILYLLPPILVMGSEIRDINDNQLMPFDADDGSHRCIAAALKGIEEVKCYVGLT